MKLQISRNEEKDIEKAILENRINNIMNNEFESQRIINKELDYNLIIKIKVNRCNSKENKDEK